MISLNQEKNEKCYRCRDAIVLPMSVGCTPELYNMDIKIIKNKKELEGTAYFEILPGEYHQKCWNPSSIFLDEESFGFIEKIIEKNIPNYDHYSFVGIRTLNWNKIIEDINELIKILNKEPSIYKLKNYVYFFFETTEKEFIDDFNNNLIKLKNLLNEFIDWIRKELKEWDVISILGL